MAAATTLARRWGWRLAVVPVAIGGIVAATALTGASSSSAAYRTATVATGDVTQTLTATGAIESASRFDAGFQVGGTVESVEVEVGDAVAAGDLLATLDTSDLEDAVAQAEEALADAEETLADDLEAQTSSSSSSSASTVAYSTEESTTTTLVVAAVYTGESSASAVTADASDATDATDATDAADAVEEARAALVAAQEALLTQYDVAQALLAEADQASTDAQTICAAFTEAAAGGDATEDAGTEDAEDAGESGTGDTSATDLAAALEACQVATEAALEASASSIAAQAVLMDLATAVDEAVAAYQQALADAAAAGSDGSDGSDGDSTTPDSGGTGSDGAGAGDDGTAGGSGDLGSAGTESDGADGGAGDQSSGDQSLGDPSTGGSALGPASSSGGSGAATGGAGAGVEDSVPTAADILADKAEITAAEAALAVAEQELEHAQLSAPVAGDVIAVGLAVDDTVSAADTEAVITIVADNSYLVTLAVSLTEVQLLAAGQPAALTLTSSGEVVDGSVSSVSTVNSGNAWSQSYAVTIAVPDPGFDIRIGAATRMQITVAASTDVVVVPTSAVADAAGEATVQVIGDDGTATALQVQTGAIGATYTEIISGLEAGDEVVLADLNQEITSDEEESSGGLLSGLNEEDESDEGFQGPGGGQLPGGGGFGGGGPGGQGA